MKKLSLFLLLLPVLISAQTKDITYKNSVFFEFSYLKSYLKKNPDYGSINQIYKVNYYATLLHREFVKLKLGAGIGIYGESTGGDYGFIAHMNTNLYFKSYFGRDKHLGFIGAGGILSPYYWDMDFYIPVGYQFKILPKLSGFISFSQLLMSFDGETTWIWDSNYNTYTIDAGLGMNF